MSFFITVSYVSERGMNSVWEQRMALSWIILFNVIFLRQQDNQVHQFVLKSGGNIQAHVNKHF